MLTVGIHENVKLTAAQIKKSRDDKPYLSLTFSQDGDGEAVLDETGLNDFNSSELTSGSGNAVEISLWGASTKIGAVELEPKRIKEKIMWQKDVLSHILAGFMPKSSINWDLFRDMNMPTDPIAARTTVAKMLTMQSEVDKINQNMNTQFMGMYLDIADELKSGEFRLKLCRTSKAKNYPAFPNSSFGFPFMEPMIIPTASSKLGYTKYEKDNGFDKGDRVEAESTAASSSKGAAEDAFGDL